MINRLRQGNEIQQAGAQTADTTTNGGLSLIGLDNALHKVLRVAASSTSSLGFRMHCEITISVQVPMHARVMVAILGDLLWMSRARIPLPVSREARAA